MSAKVSCTVLKTSTPGDRRAECNAQEHDELTFEVEHIISKKHAPRNVRTVSTRHSVEGQKTTGCVESLPETGSARFHN